MANALLLLGEAVLYFGVMVGLFRLRGRVGIGLFMCALGVMHFLETYLAGLFYVATPVGMLSPGSTVLFSGKLVMLLLLYIKEDAVTVRQPIYGLLLGNFLTVGLVILLRFHEVAPLPGGVVPDIGFIDDMGWLMVWGTTLLYLDAILIILLYEKLGHVLRRALLARIALAVASILTFDQIGFFAALHFVADVPIAAFFGGWAGKLAAAVVYSGMLFAYLRFFETREVPAPRGIADVFEALTYRERYEALVERAGRDALTGLLNRGRFNELGEEAVASSLRSATAMTLLVIDADHFKSINDRFGHSQGDSVLRMIAQQLVTAAGDGDKVFRIGGEEFAIICACPHPMGRLLGENIRQAVSASSAAYGTPCSVSIGIASVDGRIANLADLYAMADARLYAAKAGGRDRVVGEGPRERLDVGEYRRDIGGLS